MSGLRNCGQTPIVFGYGNSQYAPSQGRPMWKTGKIAAQATANSVIASAKRLIEVRHVCLSRSRIAEMSVPAWPMPIHQTKFTIAKPQATGTFTPQMPTPFTSRYTSAAKRPLATANAARKPSHQPSGVRRVSTIELILSVTDPKVWPGAITGGTPVPTTAWFGSSIRARESATVVPQLRVDVAHRGQILRARARVEIGEHRVRARLGLQARHAAGRIVQIAEDDRLGRARLLAGRLDLPVRHAAV